MPRTVSTRKKTGPKRKPVPGKRYPLNMRTTKETRDRLESAAVASGRSLVQEVEYRLGQTFLVEDVAYGGAAAASVFRILAAVAKRIEEETGKAWPQDFETYVAVSRAWKILIPQLGPRRSADLQSKLEEAFRDKWPKEPETIPVQDLFPVAQPVRGLLSGDLDATGQSAPSANEAERVRRIENNRTEWQRYFEQTRPLLEKLEELRGRLALFEGIGETAAKAFQETSTAPKRGE